jgi:inner membrane protein
MIILWWHWLVLGLLLMVGELATPGGFYILFFGIGAVVTGFVAVAGLESAPLQVLTFIVTSIAGLLLFRTRLLRMVQVDPQAPPIDTLVGEVGVAAGPIVAGAFGRVEVRGTAWSARNTSEMGLTSGARVRVVGTDGLMLLVGADGGRS